MDTALAPAAPALTPVAPDALRPLTEDDVDRAVRRSCDRIAPLWPLERFVAVNPYLGLADLRFEDAAHLLADAAGARSTLPASAYLDLIDQGRIGAADLAAALAPEPSDPAAVDRFLARVRRAPDDAAPEPVVPTVAGVATSVTGRDWVRLSTDRISSWAAAHFDGGQAMWRSADRDLPLYASWREEASIDRTPEIMGLRGVRATVRSLPADHRQATLAAIQELGVPRESLERYLHALLLRASGWAGYAARVVWEHRLLDVDDDSLAQFLAVLLGWEVAVLRGGAATGVPDAWAAALRALATESREPAARDRLADLLVLQDAFDRSAQRRLIEQLSSPPLRTGAPRSPRVQAAFCIDVRSEVLRRHLEAAAPDVDTIGFAGFFGFPMEYLPIGHERGLAQCPVLLTPRFTVAETVTGADGDTDPAEARRLAHQVRRAWKSFKMGAISCFSFVGPVGLIYLPKLFTDGRGTTRPVARPEDEGLPRWAVHRTGPAPVAADLGIPLEQRIALAEGALRGMSLTDGFAPLVLVVGHGADTVNNPYAAGLDCGACGGHSGAPNARVAAAVLDDAEVRAGLAARGICIPDTTWFVAGLHNTTTDEVVLFDRDLVPASHAALLGELDGWLSEAGRAARAERAHRLGLDGCADADAAVVARSTDWAQVRPEWGLAGCASFIAAPRSRTRDVDLGGRSFLHSYDWRQDDGFGVLELVMTAPMVVASWISLQYYASTVENDRFGSGNKTLHNVVGKVGVLEGNGGDLRSGLPWQSVHDGTRLQHEPLRLTVAIEAPLHAMNDVLAAHPSVRDLCDNRWLQLLAMDDSGHVSHRYAGGLRWEPVEP